MGKLKLWYWEVIAEKNNIKKNWNRKFRCWVERPTLCGKIVEWRASLHSQKGGRLITHYTLALVTGPAVLNHLLQFGSSGRVNWESRVCSVIHGRGRERVERRGARVGLLAAIHLLPWENHYPGIRHQGKYTGKTEESQDLPHEWNSSVQRGHLLKQF